ncbi:MAG: hypothetical protein J7L71_00480 [Spirochaetaceae bacterium]|nr:hypothetical protein [Spirochaetaceae bacterium]
MKTRYTLLLLLLISFSSFLFAGSFPIPRNNKDDSLVLIVLQNNESATPERGQYLLIDGQVKKEIRPSKDK